jgi:hypothetical protein
VIVVTRQPRAAQIRARFMRVRVGPGDGAIKWAQVLRGRFNNVGSHRATEILRHSRSVANLAAFNLKQLPSLDTVTGSTRQESPAWRPLRGENDGAKRAGSLFQIFV